MGTYRIGGGRVFYAGHLQLYFRNGFATFAWR